LLPDFGSSIILVSTIAGVDMMGEEDGEG
jgi:hypothetical protein